MSTIIKVTGKLTDTTLPILGAKLLLDGVASVDRAHSLRLIRASYSGPIIKVRRASDAATKDIGISSDGSLDAAALTAFAAGTSAFVTTLYDQGPIGKHITQAVGASQPAIVRDGVLVTQAGKPALSFDGVDDCLVSSAPGLYAAGKSSVAAVLAGVNSTQSRWWAESLATSAGNQYSLLQPDGQQSRAALPFPVVSGAFLWSDVTSTLPLFNGAVHQASAWDTGKTVGQYVDGKTSTEGFAYTRPTSTYFQAPDRFTLGGVTRSGSLAAIPMTFSEGIWLTNVLTDGERKAIEANQSAFFGTP